MDAARDAVSRHTSRRGHSTNVEEVVRPAITSETIKPHRHEVVTEAVDREIHKHHHHTTVVPLSHTETLPTRHSHNLLPVKKVEHQHEDPAVTRRALDELAAHFRDTLTTLPTTHSEERASPVVGEHFHHHVHEIVQPVIYKETIHREHVHTTIPIHEVHHVKAQHHAMSALPMKQLQEFLAFNKGRTPDHVHRSSFDGPPRSYDDKLSTTFEKLGIHSHHSRNNDSMANSRAPPSITTGATPEHNQRLLQRKPTPPQSPPGLDHHRRTNRHTIGNREGSFSSVSSASSLSSAPSTPNSPTFRQNRLPKTTTTTTSTVPHTTTAGPLNQNTVVRTPSGTITTNTNTTNTFASSAPRARFDNNPITTTPNQKMNGTGPVQIVGPDESPRSSDEAGYPTRQRGSFMSRFTGTAGNRTNSTTTRRF